MLHHKGITIVSTWNGCDDSPRKIPSFSFDDDKNSRFQKGHSEPLLSFVPATEMIYQEEQMHDEDYFNFLKPETELLMKTSQPLPFLPLTIYTFPAGSIKDFPRPTRNADGLYSYYLMDAASLLPVMALGIREGDDFADFCAAPGGKTLAVAFMNRTGTLMSHS